MIRHPGWPAQLHYERVGLRPLRFRDAKQWRAQRLRNEQWLVPWEPSSPRSWQARHSYQGYFDFVGQLHKLARHGLALPWAVTYDQRLVGQLTVMSIVRGAFDSGHVGYWVDHKVSGQGVMTTALALAVDHCFFQAGLHRLQVDIRPENAASRRVVERLGFRQEAHFLNYLDIAGAWRDHLGYAITLEDCPRGLVNRLPDLLKAAKTAFAQGDDA